MFNSPPVPQNPNSLSKSPDKLKMMDNLKVQEENSIRKKQPKNKKKNPKMSSEHNILIQEQQLIQSNPIIQANDPKFQEILDPEKEILHEKEKENQGSLYKGNQRNQEQTNYSSQKTVSNMRKTSIFQDEEMNQPIEVIFKRKERQTCYEKPTQFMERQNGPIKRQAQDESVTQVKIQAIQKNVAYECDQKEREYGFTQPVRESNSNLVKSFDIQKIDGQLDLCNPFNPDVNQHSDELKVSQQCVKQVQREDQLNSDGKKGIVIPERKIEDFVMDVQMDYQLHKFKTGDYQRDQNQNFQHRYELYYPRDPNVPRIRYQISKKIIQGLMVTSINCGMNVVKKDKNKPPKKSKKRFYNTDDQSVLMQVIKVVISFMKKGYDFILLQQACDPIFQIMLLKAIRRFNKLNGHIYFYPQHLEKDLKDFRTTTILTRHQVKMGQFRFKLQQFHQLPVQAFVEFKINVNGKWQNVCILCCHLKSNRGHRAGFNKLIRMEQVKAIKKFSKKFDRFFCIGDVNIPTSQPFDQENRIAEQIFFDAVNYGISEIRGTFLYRNDARKVIPQRNDRVWLNNESALKASVLINYHDILLESCKDLKLDQTKMLEQADHDELPYITVTDHTILDIEIMFTK